MGFYILWNVFDVQMGDRRSTWVRLVHAAMWRSGMSGFGWIIMQT